MPKASVIIPAFNSGAFIKKAVASALEQTMTDIEVLVVDDGSTDETAETVAQIAQGDGRLRLIRFPENRGVSAARNAALDQAEGEWIAVLDADDWYSPERLAQMIEAATTEKVDVVMDNQTMLRDPNDPGRSWTLMPRDEGSFFLSPLEFLQAIGGGKPESYAGLKPVFRRSTIETHHLRYREDMSLGEDANFLIRFLAFSKGCLVLRSPYYFRLLRQGSLRSTWSSAHVSARLDAYEELLEIYAGDAVISDLLRSRREQFRYFARVMAIFAPARRLELGRAIRAGLHDLPAVPGLARYIARLLLNKLRAKLRLSATG